MMGKRLFKISTVLLICHHHIIQQVTSFSIPFPRILQHSSSLRQTQRRSSPPSCSMKNPIVCNSILALHSSSSQIVDYQSGGDDNNEQQQSQTTNHNKQLKPGFIEGPPIETKPNYEEIHGPMGKVMDKIFLSVFRSKMAEKVGIDSKLPMDDYQGLMELTAAMGARYSDKTQVQLIAQDILRSLFPSWLPGQFAWMFAKPFPAFSARMNAWATYVAGTWLMGECEINNCDTDNGAEDGINQGLLVKRCRFLEESGCASICVNSCKLPTERFFNEDMGLPLTMTPDYETGECQFSFGLTPSDEGELEAKSTPCLSRCPTAGGMRQWHQGGPAISTNDDIMIKNGGSESGVCPMMKT